MSLYDTIIRYNIGLSNYMTTVGYLATRTVDRELATAGVACSKPASNSGLNVVKIRL